MSSGSLLQIYEADLSNLDRLDRAYYGKPNPTRAERAAYEHRKQLRETLRSHFDVSIAPQIENEFLVTLIDRASGRTVVSSPMCRLAHEVKNKLNIIVGYADLVSTIPGLDSDSKEALHQIVVAGKKIAEMVSESSCPKKG